MQATPPSGWVQMVPCPRCGQAIDPTKAVYSKQGELICKSCESGDLLAEGYTRAARSTCFGALGAGALSIFLNPFYIVSVVAIVGAVRALTLIHRPEYRSVIGGSYPVLLIAAIGGLAAALVQPGLRFLVTLLAILL